MELQVIKSLFKPYKLNRKSFFDFLDDKTKRNFLKHRLWFECSKSEDETCINTDCRYNYIKSHQDELYLELHKEIIAERTGGG